MKRLVVASVMALAASVLVSDTASAHNAFGYPMGGYGFGVNFGGPFAQIGGAVRTPPYFAVNPPVYYGTRYARPYGMSPFPALPGLSATESYRVRPAANFYYPPTPPVAPAAPCCNPYVTSSPCPTDQCEASEKKEPVASTSPKPFTLGKVRTNPFVVSTDRLANK